MSANPCPCCDNPLDLGCVPCGGTVKLLDAAPKTGTYKLMVQYLGSLVVLRFDGTEGEPLTVGFGYLNPDFAYTAWLLDPDGERVAFPGAEEAEHDCIAFRTLPVVGVRDGAPPVSTPCPVVTVDGTEIEGHEVTVLRGEEVVGDVDPETGLVNVAPCPIVEVNGVNINGPIVTVLQDGNPVGSVDPATGVVTVPPCPNVCVQIGGMNWADIKWCMSEMAREEAKKDLCN